MKELFIAIYNKLTGATLSSLVRGQIFIGRAPKGTAYPYIIFFPISDVPEDTFKNKIDSVAIQFSLFSSNSSLIEIEGIYSSLIALLDDAVLTITGLTQCILYRENTIFIDEQVITPSGTEDVWHYAVDYQIIVETT